MNAARMCWRWLVVAAVTLVVAGLGTPAIAQYAAPAGNEHPRELAEHGADARPPFGQPGPTRLDLAKKEAFARGVNIEPLRDLAVYHQGRIKILDTLARETISGIMGRRNYMDLDVPDGGGEVRRVAYDPLFTYMDLVIDPGYYVNRPLIHVEFLPLRETFLERMYQSPEEREWWKRVGRLKPLKLAEHLTDVETKHGFEPAMRQGLDRVRSSLMTYQEAWQDLKMVASDAPDKPWSHLSTLDPASPAGKAMSELGEAWRAGDAARANAAISQLAQTLPTINAAMYPDTRRSLEAAYNRVNAFEWGYWFYALALLSLLLAFGTGRRWLVWTGVSTLVLATGMHAFGFVARCIIAERFAIQNQFESMTGVSLFAAIVGIGLMLARRQYLFGAAAAGVGFMVLITATQTGIPGVRVEREAPILNTSVLLKYHVTTVLVSYGLIALGFMVALFYLGTHYAARFRSGGGSGGSPARVPAATPALAGAGGASMLSVSASALGLSQPAPTGDTGGAIAATPASMITRKILDDLDKAQMIILQLAFWTLGVGILLGAWWADHSWGRWWAFDPKELWALVTWIVYLIVIHVRLGGLKDKGLTTAWLSVVGFIVMLWTYFGVNLLLPGLHAYA